MYPTHSSMLPLLISASADTFPGHTARHTILHIWTLGTVCLSTVRTDPVTDSRMCSTRLPQSGWGLCTYCHGPVHMSDRPGLAVPCLYSRIAISGPDQGWGINVSSVEEGEWILTWMETLPAGWEDDDWAEVNIFKKLWIFLHSSNVNHFIL